MTVKLLTEQHLEFLSLKGGCTGLSESTLVKMPHYWKSGVAALTKFSTPDLYCFQDWLGLLFPMQNWAIFLRVLPTTVGGYLLLSVLYQA